MSDGRERRRPVIGISAYREDAKWGVWQQPAVLIPAAYVDKVTAAGGIALVIPPSSLTQAAAGQLLDMLDGLLLAGGADLNPELYGEEPHAETAGWRRDRDDAELALVDGALDRDLPVLGICRGLQIMTVHAGGRLEQHLPDVVGHERHRPAPGVFGEHEVTMVDGSLAAATLGKSVTVKSYHHQGVADPGTLSVVGKADDGTTEAVQDTRRRFALGVLWHPEAGDDPRLFDALVAAASETETVPRWAMTETDKHPKRSLIELALLDKGPVHILRSKGDTLAAVGTALLVVGVLGMFIVLTTHESTRATVQNLIWWVSLVAAVAGGASRVGGAVLRTLALAREAETSRAE